MFSKQKALQKIIQKKDPNRHLYRDEPFLGYRIFMITEAIEAECKELKRETQWKWWKNYTNATQTQRGAFSEEFMNDKKLKEECADIWHFLIQLSLEIGLTPEDIYKHYLDKNKENINRQDNNY